MVKKDTILINIMYNGSYLNKYIGHEVINLKEADNHQHYIYVNPYGKVNKKYYEKINYMLLVRRSGYPNTLEILAIASDLNPCIKQEEFDKINTEYEEDAIDFKYISTYKSKPRQETVKKIEKLKDRIKHGLKYNNELIKLDLEDSIREDLIKRIDYLINGQDVPEDLKNRIEKNFDNIKKAFNCQRAQKRGKKIHECQMNYIDENNKNDKDGLTLTYSDKKLEEIFEKNDGNGCSIYTTYHARTFIRLETPVFITDTKILSKQKKYSEIKLYNINKDIEKTEQIKFSKSSLIMYFGEDYKNTSKAYKKIKYLIEDIIKNQSKRDKNISNKNNNDKRRNNIDKNKRFFEIIGQEYNELAFSNLFQYIFGKKARTTFKNFVKKYLKLDLDDDFQIEREKNHVDLLISDGTHLIIIENKIKSDINGTQLTDYCYLTHGMKKNKNDYIENENLKDKFIKYRDDNKKFCLFAPDYNHIKKDELTAKCNIDKKKKEYKYELVEYSKIWDYFSNHYSTKDGEKDSYYDEFLNAIERHSHGVDNIQEQQMFERFEERIKELNNPLS